MRLDMTGFPPDFLSGRFIVRYIVLPLVENESLQLGLIGLIEYTSEYTVVSLFRGLETRRSYIYQV